MSICLCKISTGETLIGEVVDTDEEHYVFEYPFTLQQHPTFTDNGFTEVITLLPYIYKFTNSGKVKVKKDTIVSEVSVVNNTFKKFYMMNFIKQTMHDARQASIIDEIHERVPSKKQVKIEEELTAIDNSIPENRTIH